MTNKKAIKALFKVLEDTPHEIGLAVMRERMLTHAYNDLKSINSNPEAWTNPILSASQYKDYCRRVIDILEFNQDS